MRGTIKLKKKNLLSKFNIYHLLNIIQFNGLAWLFIRDNIKISLLDKGDYKILPEGKRLDKIIIIIIIIETMILQEKKKKIRKINDMFFYLIKGQR